MERTRPMVIRPDEATMPAGPPTPGMDRRQLLEDGDRWLGWVRTEAGTAGGWHHHGDRDSYIYMLSGSITIEWGADGRHEVTAVTGDLILSPRRTVHREITGADGPAEFLVVRVGPGPLNVNVYSASADPHAS